MIGLMIAGVLGFLTILAVFAAIGVHDLDAKEGFWFLAMLLFIAALFAGGIGGTLQSESAYKERIDNKYGIHIVDMGEDYVVYNEGNCYAKKLEYDKLDRVGCGENSELLTIKD